MRIQGGKVLVLKDSPQGITECQIGMAFGKGRAGNSGGFVRHRLNDVRVERHKRRPSLVWVRHDSYRGPYYAMAHSPRVPHRCESALEKIFYYRNIFRSKRLKKASQYTHAKDFNSPRTPPSTIVTIVASA